jgi:UDP-GlcNAc:undecaprenyl-phosphate GlcNAc-1-phosphate transferase
MELSIAVNLISVSFFATIVFTGFLRTLAKRYKFLIDLPDKNRKFHKRPTPLVGGLGIHVAMLFGMVILFLSVDTKIYDQSDTLKTINSNLQIYNDNQFEEYQVSASKIDSGLSDTSQFDVIVEGAVNPIVVIKNSKGNFELVTPAGELKEFSFLNGTLRDLNENKALEVKTPTENSYFAVTPTMLAVVIMGIFLQLMMLIDDISGLSQKRRFLIQSAASIGVIILSGEYITNIGIGMFGWNGDLGYFGIIFTIFAVTGIINAFNMIDGINGLCSGSALIAFLAIIYFGITNALSYGSLIIASALIGFLVYNLGLFGKKRAVFLGDNGSNLLGFLVAWSCIYYSSESIKLINPITALWLVSIPLWDCIHLIFKRSLGGKGAFEGDREHFHHVLFDRTALSDHWPLISILITSLILASIGILLDSLQKPFFSLITFLSLGFIFIFIKRKLSARVY